MKKIVVLFAVLATSLCIFLASCDDLKDTFTGWNYVGDATSNSDCSKKVTEAGYYFVYYDKDTGACYGKNNDQDS